MMYCYLNFDPIFMEAVSAESGSESLRKHNVTTFSRGALPYDGLVMPFFNYGTMLLRTSVANVDYT